MTLISNYLKFIRRIRRWLRVQHRRQSRYHDVGAGVKLITSNFFYLQEEITSTQVRRRKIGLHTDNADDVTCSRRRKYGSNMEEKGCDTLLWSLFEAVHYQITSALQNGEFDHSMFININ